MILLPAEGVYIERGAKMVIAGGNSGGVVVGG